MVSHISTAKTQSCSQFSAFAVCLQNHWILLLRNNCRMDVLKALPQVIDILNARLHEPCREKVAQQEDANCACPKMIVHKEHVQFKISNYCLCKVRRFGQTAALFGNLPKSLFSITWLTQ